MATQPRTVPWPVARAAALAALLLLLQACATPQGPAPAGPATQPEAAAQSLGGRMIADAREYPWSAVGRLNYAGQGFCTGVVIGPQHVLTQASCLYSEREKRWWQPQEMHFLAAYQKDSFLADSRIASFNVAQGYNPQAGSSLASLTSNWAAVTLQEPIGAKTGWLGLEWDSPGLRQAAEGGDTAYLRAGYRNDWPHAVSLHFGCRDDGGAVQLCAATPSELALPPFVADGGELHVLADFYVTTPGEASPLARLTGNSIGNRRLGRAQPPSRESLIGAQPTATAAQLLASLGYDVSGGSIGSAAAAFRRDRGLPASETVDMALLAALISAAQQSGR